MERLGEILFSFNIGFVNDEPNKPYFTVFENLFLLAVCFLSIILLVLIGCMVAARSRKVGDSSEFDRTERNNDWEENIPLQDFNHE